VGRGAGDAGAQKVTRVTKVTWFTENGFLVNFVTPVTPVTLFDQLTRPRKSALPISTPL
jgi:hypothetical protein